MSDEIATPGVGDEFRCSTASRWLPRTLAGTAVFTTLLVTGRFENAPGVVGSARLRMALWFVAALFALWALRKGAELRLRVSFAGEGLVFDYGKAPQTLRLDEIETVRFDPPFAWRRSWVAATGITDRQGRLWRLPVALVNGDLLVAEVLTRSGREDLAAWVEALGILPRMRRGSLHQLAAYLFAVAVALAAIGFYLR